MEVQETAVTAETPTETVAAAPEATLTVEQQLASLNKISQQRHKMFSELIKIHAMDILSTLAFTPGLSGAKKQGMINDFGTTLQGVLDFGLDITKVAVPEKGVFGKRTAAFGGILAQALDNKFVLLAQNLNKAETTNATEEVK